MPGGKSRRYCVSNSVPGPISPDSASAGLATVIRAWIDRQALADALGLDPARQVLLSQTVGHPKR